MRHSTAARPESAAASTTPSRMGAYFRDTPWQKALWVCVPICPSESRQPCSGASRSPRCKASGAGARPGQLRGRGATPGASLPCRFRGRPSPPRGLNNPLRLCRGRPHGGAVTAVAKRPRTLDNYCVMQALCGRRAAMCGWGGG